MRISRLRDPAPLEAEGDVVGDRHVREERVALEDGVHVPLVRRQPDDVAVGEEDRPDVGSSKPPIIRSVVVFPQPDGPSSAKKEPRGISSEMPSTARSLGELLHDVLEADVRRHRVVIRLPLLAPLVADAPVVELLPELEVEERLGRDDLGQLADPVRDVEEPVPVGADDLDEDVEAAGGDDDVVGLVPRGELVRDRLGRAGRPMPTIAWASKPRPSGFVTPVTWRMLWSQSRP